MRQNVYDDQAMDSSILVKSKHSFLCALLFFQPRSLSNIICTILIVCVCFLADLARRPILAIVITQPPSSWSSSVNNSLTKQTMGVGMNVPQGIQVARRKLHFNFVSLSPCFFSQYFILVISWSLMFNYRSLLCVFSRVAILGLILF